MSSTKEVKVLYCKSDTDIGPYILNLKNIQDPESSIEYRGSHIQLRGVSKDKNSGCVSGRLCRVRETEKPTVGEAYNVKEEYLQKDIIESSNFIYNPKNLEIIIQNNRHVGTNPNSLLSMLLTKTHKKDLKNGLGITAIIRDDALKEIIENRGSIVKIKVQTTKEGANIIARETGDDVEMGDDFLDGVSYKERELSYKMDFGSVKQSLIEKLKGFFDNKKIKDASFLIEGSRSPIKLSEFAKYELLNIEVDKGSFDTSDFNEKLLQLMNNNET